MATLTVHFRGICTHFSHLVPGIPHRVVLPNATALRFGLVDMPEGEGTQPYVLLPHFAVLRVPGETLNLDVPGAMAGGLIYDAVRLHVANATGDRVGYVCEYRDVAHLTYYVDAYQFSDEIVLGGRASCYFDVISGTVAPDYIDIGGREKIAGVRITIETAGPPVLAVSPMFQATHRRPAVSYVELPGDDVKLTVANIGFGCGEGGADGFDFLLNYLTLKGGLPRHLRHRPPQFPPQPMPFAAALAEATERLAHIRSPNDVVLPDFGMIDLSETLSCSNTQYP